MNRRIRKRVSYYEQHSDRIIFIMIETKPKPTSIVHVYMPTSQSTEEELEKVYKEIEELIKHVRGDENLIIIGDRNAIIGKGKDERVWFW